MLPPSYQVMNTLVRNVAKALEDEATLIESAARELEQARSEGSPFGCGTNTEAKMLEL